MKVHQEFDSESTHKIIKDLCKIGPRVSGSESEIRAVLLIEEQFRNAGLSTIQILGHEYQYYQAKKATFGLPDDSLVIDGVPCWMSATTLPEGIESESVYIGSSHMIQHLKEDDIKDKLVIALYDDGQKENIESWKKLYAMSPEGVVFLDMERNTAPRAFLNKELTSSFSKIPSLVVSAKHTRALHEHMFGEQLKIVVEGSVRPGNVQSIQCKLKGKTSQTILVCAHHDTHSFTPGATDNAAGVAIMLEIARILAKRKPNLSYRFVSFGGEELGLMGSWAYASEVNLQEFGLCINFDSIGELPGMLLALSAGSDDMIDWVSTIATENEYPARCRRTATTGGDNKVFAANGIPTIHLASYGTTSGKVSHSWIDDASLLTPYTIGELGKFACRIIEKIDASGSIPFDLEMPDDLLRAAKERVIDTV